MLQGIKKMIWKNTSLCSVLISDSYLSKVREGRREKGEDDKNKNNHKTYLFFKIKRERNSSEDQIKNNQISFMST